MARFNYSKRPLVENSSIIRVSNFIRKALIELEKQGFRFDLKKEADVLKFKEIVEKTAIISREKEIKDYITLKVKENHIKLDYSKSNLKGYIFWFLCNKCNRRVRFLYIPPNSDELLCRECHHLVYEKQNKKSDKIVKKIIINPSLIAYFKPKTLKDALAYYKAIEIIDNTKKQALIELDKYYNKSNN